MLFENPGARERLNHLGVEVFDTADVDSAERRLSAAGIADAVQRNETCCHATQDKVWSREPDGLRWEWYRITDDEPEPAPRPRAGACCAGAGQTDAAGAD